MKRLIYRLKRKATGCVNQSGHCVPICSFAEMIKSHSCNKLCAERGKSSVSVALAESIADMGKSVILVDADIRNSVMASKLQITGADKGLSHFLSGQCVLADVIMATNIPKFHILLSGPRLRIRQSFWNPNVLLVCWSP